MKEFKMSYRGHICGWFRECGCLFFAHDARKADYQQYDSRALSGLKKLFKENVDIDVIVMYTSSQEQLPERQKSRRYDRHGTAELQGSERIRIRWIRT